MLDPTFILHVDSYLGAIIQQYSVWIYVILFFILFIETGIVIAPFLPGDSLIFAAGAFAALGLINIFWLFFVFAAGAIGGDTVNYWIGSKFGSRAAEGKIRFIKKSHIERTNEFYKKHGGKTIVLARFLPVVRTIAPFVAGAGKMKYKRFFTFNVIGGVAWVSAFLCLGYFFGGVPIVKENFSIVIILIIFISLIPAAAAFLMHKIRKTGKI